MPIYEYECKKCLSRFEVYRGFDEKGGDSCPKCGGEGRRIYLPTPIIFKGSGFYITDSRKNVDHSSKESQSAKPGPGKPATESGSVKAATKTASSKPSERSEPDTPATKPESKNNPLQFGFD